MANGEGLKELKRLFGDVVEVSGADYLIRFPKRLSQSHDFGESEYPDGFLPPKPYDPNASDDDEGATLRRKRGRDEDLPPSQQAYNELTRMRIVRSSEMSHHSMGDDDILRISRFAAEQPIFVNKLKTIPDDDDRFRRLTDRGYDDDAHSHHDDPAHDGEKTKEAPIHRVRRMLDALNDKTKWEVAEFPLTAGGNNELVLATTKPVANAFGALYLITEALGIAVADMPKPVKGRAVLPVKLLLEHEDNIDKLENLNPKDFAAVLNPATPGGPGGPGGKK